MVLLLMRSVFIYFSNNFSGEQWETTYGESSWRMAVLAMCLPETVNRFVLVILLIYCFCSTPFSSDFRLEVHGDRVDLDNRAQLN